MAFELEINGKHWIECHGLRLSLALCLFRSGVMLDLFGCFIRICNGWRAVNKRVVVERWGISVHRIAQCVNLCWADVIKPISWKRKS